jgi:hypothetical protein
MMDSGLDRGVGIGNGRPRSPHRGSQTVVSHLLFAGLSNSRRPSKRTYPHINHRKILMKISNNKFSNEEVVLDFHEYNTCEFTNCRFVVLGFGPFSLNQCEVKNCEFTFAGPAASVIQTMSTIYNIGDQGKNLIEGTFDQIRKAGGGNPA